MHFASMRSCRAGCLPPMSLFTVSLNHHSAPVNLRSRFAFSQRRLPAALHSLQAWLGRCPPEVTQLSTCNRTELYVASSAGAAGAQAALLQPTTDWLAAQGGPGASDLMRHAQVTRHCDAARHVLRVGAGEMIELAASHFAARKPQSMAVANRSAGGGLSLARRLGTETFEPGGPVTAIARVRHRRVWQAEYALPMFVMSTPKAGLHPGPAPAGIKKSGQAAFS